MNIEPTGHNGKQGNTSWVQCRCENWFHVDNALLDAGDVPMHCPACHAEFHSDGAARVCRAG